MMHFHEIRRHGRCIGYLTKSLWGFHAYWSPQGELLGMRRFPWSAEEALVEMMGRNR
jgi:hypothetical protein